MISDPSARLLNRHICRRLELAPSSALPPRFSPSSPYARTVASSLCFPRPVSKSTICDFFTPTRPPRPWRACAFLRLYGCRIMRMGACNLTDVNTMPGLQP